MATSKIGNARGWKYSDLISQNGTFTVPDARNKEIIVAGMMNKYQGCVNRLPPFDLIGSGDYYNGGGRSAISVQVTKSGNDLIITYVSWIDSSGTDISAFKVKVAYRDL